MQHKILVICQDQQLLPEIKSSLEQTDCEIHCAVNYQQAVDRISRFHYIMVIMDLDFSEASGIEVLRRLPPDKVSTSAYITGFTREYSSGADIPRRLLNVYLSSPPSFIALMSESILFNCFTSFFVLRSLQSRMVGSSSFSRQMQRSSSRTSRIFRGLYFPCESFSVRHFSSLRTATILSIIRSISSLPVLE